MKQRLLHALLGQPVDRTPVWMMRQAGRYLPEYRALRQQAPDFMSFCRTPELAAQATLQPIARFPLDAAIIFSDILTVPDAMGLPVRFVTGEGPQFDTPIRNKTDLNGLKSVDVEKDLGYVMSAIQQTKAGLPEGLPLIGFSGSPWTLAAYMIEGGGSKQWLHPRMCAYQQPQLLLALLQQLTTVVIDYVNAQVAAGADAIMIFDSWGGLLSFEGYQQFSLQFMQQIAQGMTRQRNGQTVPLIFYTKQAAPWLSLLSDSGCDAVGLDWTVDLKQARQAVGHAITLQGNLDPCVLFADEATIKQRVDAILDDMQGHPHVFNLGHGIDQHTPISGVMSMFDALNNYHQSQEH